MCYCWNAVPHSATTFFFLPIFYTLPLAAAASHTTAQSTVASSGGPQLRQEVTPGEGIMFKKYILLHHCNSYLHSVYASPWQCICHSVYAHLISHAAISDASSVCVQTTSCSRLGEKSNVKGRGRKFVKNYVMYLNTYVPSCTPFNCICI